MHLMESSLLYLTTLLCIVQIQSHDSNTFHRDFRIDYQNNCFLKDGKPFRYAAGSFHYFRALPETWRQKLRTIRAAGLNAVDTYVEWSLHNPKPNTYVWNGIGDIERFIRLAAEEDLLVILRPGPYICAERDMGGFPYWLRTKYPNIKLRTTDADYLRESRIWYNQLFHRLTPLLYGNGGPIVTVQVENEYGSFGCDKNYLQWLRNETLRHVGDKAVLFTADGPGLVKCGQIENVLATINFGAGSAESIDGYWKQLRKYQPKGPLVNSEFYPGWLTHWQDEHLSTVSAKPVVNAFRHQMAGDASVNFYMFYGGTNFGFTAGANDGGIGKYQPDITSYDYDAPMNEAGDPTPKYMQIRDAIKEFLPMPNISVPMRALKMSLPTVKLQTGPALLSNHARSQLGHFVMESRVPATFESIDQYSGFVLYETVLPDFRKDPSILSVPNIRDRAHVLVDNVMVGILSRENAAKTVTLSAAYAGKTLQILVENQGRINYHIMDDYKGLNEVQFDGKPLEDWIITGYPLDNTKKINDLIRESSAINSKGSEILYNGPNIYYTEFDIERNEIRDTYINPIGWGKGVIFINGFNLGRYWPMAGPQITVYLPKELLKHEKNSLVLLELHKTSKDQYLKFSDKPIFD